MARRARTIETASRGPTLRDLIEIVLPDGTRGTGSWDEVCDWPPDLFAAVAFITERSGLYSQQTFTAYWCDGFECSENWIRTVRESGQAWADSGSPPDHVETLWKELIENHPTAKIDDRSAGAENWKRSEERRVGKEC